MLIQTRKNGKMLYRILIFGTNLMIFSSVMSVRTAVASIPWRRNLLTIAWFIGFVLFWIGSRSPIAEVTSP